MEKLLVMLKLLNKTSCYSLSPHVYALNVNTWEKINSSMSQRETILDTEGALRVPKGFSYNQPSK